MSVASVSTNAGTILNGESYPDWSGGNEAGFNAKLMEMLSFTPTQVLNGTQTTSDNGIHWNFTTTVGSTTYPFDFVPSDKDFTITYTVKATDSSGQGNTASNGNAVDNDTHTITITIHGTNDAGSLVAESVMTNEDTNLSGNVFTNAIQDPDAGQALAVTTFTIGGMAGTYNAGNSVNVTSGGTTIGTLVLNADGSYTFNPAQHYSGAVPQITYGATSGGDSVGTSTLDITVNPVSDRPITGANITVTTDEDTAVALSDNNTRWKLPIITDNTDLNGAATDGDWPERLGLLKLYGLKAGTKIQDGSGNELYAATSDSEITIKIVADDGSSPYAPDGKPYHTADAHTADATLTLTRTQFEALKILPKENSSTDLNLTLEAREYEVDNNGNPPSGAQGAVSFQNIEVMVAPITDSDNFNLTAGTSPGGNEDDAINLKNAFTFTQSVDADQSEHYTLNFSCDNDERVELKFQNGGWQSLAEFNNANHDFTGGSFPDVYIRTKGNDSRDITNLKLKLTAQDHDEDP
ncbi:MAG: hypothetical protein CSB48_01050 [Proteobacteria bacterium]|nr:MAG: hypothetical protein CSB48_01050 [Pseudomonadota bacterium]